MMMKAIVVIVCLTGFTLNLAIGSPPPPTVRVIYFLPKDRQPQRDMDTQLDTLMTKAQLFFADVMEANGFGRKTFRLETDVHEKVLVHHVTGQFNDTFYHNDTGGKVHNELEQFFDTSENIYYAAVDVGSERFDVDRPDSFICGQAVGPGALTPASGTCFNFRVIAHELGHTFGLTHNRYIHSNVESTVDSFCAAEWLDAHPYFNTVHSTDFDDPTKITMIPPSSASSPNAIRFRFEVTDTDGLHQAQLYVPDLDSLIACKGLNSDPDADIEFVTTKIGSPITFVYLRVIDTNGNISNQGFTVDITNLLLPPQFITIPDANLAATVREYLIGPASTELTTHTMLRLTNLGSNTERPITDISGLEHAINLVALSLYYQNGITDISFLRELKNLEILELSGTSISDVSALAELKNLETLYLYNTDISDVSPLSGLTNLQTLELQNTAVSDLAPLVANAGLANGDYVDVRIKILNYPSIYIHIPALQERGVEVFFENRTPVRIHMISGNDQEAAPGAVLENAFVVEVQDEKRVAFEGVPVTFLVTAGGGTLSTTNTMTDADGKAESTLTLGPTPGANTVTVSVTEIQEQQTFTAEGIRVPLAFWIISGDKQEGQPGEALANPFAIEVRDQSGEPLPGVKVTFMVSSGGGTLSAGSTITDDNGRAESTLTLGTNPGSSTVTVSVAGIQEKQTVSAIAEPPPIPEDVNGDDVVNIFDLTLVASAISDGNTDLSVDVNGDGVVNVFDLVLVAEALGN